MSDMRQLFDTARGELPPAPFTVDQITEAGRRRVHRRRLARTASAAGAAAAVVAVAAFGIPMLRGAAPVPADPAPRISAFPAAIPAFTVGDFRVGRSVEVTASRKTTAIARGQGVVGLLTVFRAGASDPTGYRSGTAVKVAGQDGYTRTFDEMAPLAQPNVIDGRVITSEQVVLPAVAWQYKAGAWATIVARPAGPAGMTAADVLTVAGRAESALITGR